MILVTGATGNVGSELVHALSQAGEPVRALTRDPSSARIPAGNPARIWTGTQVITTDFFAFDDTTDFYGLRAADPAARAVEMGDAVLGLVATTDLADPPPWVIIRNASDPQMTGGDIATEKKQAAAIYEQYGVLDAAIAAYRKVEKPEGPITPTDTFVLAQTHLKALHAIQ